MIEPDLAAGRRKDPIAAILLDYLIDHRLARRRAPASFGVSQLVRLSRGNQVGLARGSPIV